MKKIILLTTLLAITGCASDGERSLFDRLEFEDEENGCFRLNGTVDTNANPFMSSNVTVNLVKRKGEGPDC